MSYDELEEVDDFGTLEEGDEVLLRYDSNYSQSAWTDREATVIRAFTDPPRLSVSPDGSDKEWRTFAGQVRVEGAMSWGKKRPREIGHRCRVYRDP